MEKFINNSLLAQLAMSQLLAIRDRACEVAGKCHIVVEGSVVQGHPTLVSRLRPDGTIILDIGHNAVRDWNVENELISFSCRMSGVNHTLTIPIRKIVAAGTPTDYFHLGAVAPIINGDIFPGVAIWIDDSKLDPVQDKPRPTLSIVK